MVGPGKGRRGSWPEARNVERFAGPVAKEARGGSGQTAGPEA